MITGQGFVCGEKWKRRRRERERRDKLFVDIKKETNLYGRGEAFRPRGGVLSADEIEEEEARGESVSVGMKASFDNKIGKQTLVIAARARTRR